MTEKVEEVQATAAQASAEGAQVLGEVELNGKPFRLAGRPRTWSLMQLQHGLTTPDADVLGPLYLALEDTVHPDDWAAFGQHAHDTDAGQADLLGVINQAVEAFTGRPTGQPSSSSDGRQPTSAASTGGSSSRATRMA